MDQETELKERLLNDLHLAIYQEACKVLEVARNSGAEAIFEPDQIQALKGKIEYFLQQGAQANSNFLKTNLKDWATDAKWEEGIKNILPLLVQHLFPQESIRE